MKTGLLYEWLELNWQFFFRTNGNKFTFLLLYGNDQIDDDINFDDVNPS